MVRIFLFNGSLAGGGESYIQDLWMKSYDGSDYTSALAPGGSKYEQLEKEVRDLLHAAYGEDVCTSVRTITCNLLLAQMLNAFAFPEMF